MIKEKIKSFQEFLNYLDTQEIMGYEINLFRGQSENYELLPAICRDNSSIDTTKLEIKMLEDFKRRAFLLTTQKFTTDWEWLIFAQHYGLKTRLLDWTSNPLIALWFACKDPKTMSQNSYVYVLSCEDNLRVDINKYPSPFKTNNTKILRPMLNNERIVAQYGWFTAHKFSARTKKFVSLETNTKTRSKLTEIEIPAKLKKEILRKLSLFGINHGSIFPDVVGLSLHLNWKYLEDRF